jgi:hypothetical protein
LHGSTLAERRGRGLRVHNLPVRRHSRRYRLRRDLPRHNAAGGLLSALRDDLPAEPAVLSIPARPAACVHRALTVSEPDSVANPEAGPGVLLVWENSD